MQNKPTRALIGAMKSTTYRLNTSAANLATFIEGLAKKKEINKALLIFKEVLESRTPDFAEKVLKGAPFFIALVARMSVDRIAEIFELKDRERASQLREFAQENERKPKKIMQILGCTRD